MKMWNAHCLHIQVESCSNRNLLRRRKQLFCLFTRPEVDIQTNDFLVITHFGKKIEAVAGFPECMKSHNNIPVKLDKETV